MNDDDEKDTNPSTQKKYLELDCHMEEAINLHHHAIGTDQKKITDLEYWLHQGG
jgi:hypothetical protein